MPDVLELIQNSHIPLISARERYESKMRSKFVAWKTFTFCDEVQKVIALHPETAGARVIAMGDAEMDMVSAKECEQFFTKENVPIVTSLIKFDTFPNVKRIEEELLACLCKIEHYSESKTGGRYEFLRVHGAKRPLSLVKQSP